VNIYIYIFFLKKNRKYRSIHVPPWRPVVRVSQFGNYYFSTYNYFSLRFSGCPVRDNINRYTNIEHSRQ